MFEQTLGSDSKEAAQVVSEDKDTEASKEASTYRTVLSSEGSLHKRVACSLQMQKIYKKQKLSTCVTVLSSDSKINEERLCCIFQGSTLKSKV